MMTLESHRLFCHLPNEALQRLGQHVKELHFAAGSDVFREGDPGDGLYFVKSGTVEISNALGNGERHVFARVPPGEVFGEMAVLDGLPRSAFATARTDSAVCFVSREKILCLLEESPELPLKFVREISGRLRDFNRQYLREILQAERLVLVGRFARSIVHDLKNPLAVIRMATELVCEEQGNADMQKTAHGWITKQLDRVTSMVNDILDFTRRPPTAPALSPGDYSDFVNWAVTELQAEPFLKHCSLECDNPPPAVKVKFNSRRLSRVFWNLVHNAVDAMPDGGRIRLRFKLTASEVVTEIEDSGKGIAPEVSGRLFEPFASFGKAKGTGLGLAISRQIIEEHGGQITARSQPGSGATFCFTLPRLLPNGSPG
jgi:two-component system, NtrC family, sensor histidine kinase HydH